MEIYGHVLTYWLVKHELRVASSNLRVMSSNPEVTSSTPRVTSLNLQVTSYEFKYTSYEYKFTSSNSKSASWEIKSTSQEIKSTSWSNKTTSQIVNIRVKRENSEFKILNFTSYKKFYFHCLANVELKPHTKVLKNLFHNMALKKHIWPLYCHHILAAGKLRSIDSNKT